MTSASVESPSGGYDDGYKSCACFWGREPGSLIPLVLREVPSIEGLRVLDVGCGEGKNAVYLANQGAIVEAIDISYAALQNAHAAWPDVSNISWQQEDIRTHDFVPASYDLVIAYGLLHCLRNASEIGSVIQNLQSATRPGGLHVVCSFNERSQDLSAHPDFNPCLLSHASYLAYYCDWQIVFSSDKDLIEVHPHNRIVHKHSMTRFIARRPE